ncbi:MAG: hypothetical protein ACR2P1_29795 [Pseudomonadales bacterium]
MGLLSLQSVILGSFLCITGGCFGWWLGRYFLRVRERQARQQRQLPAAGLVKSERELSTANIEKADYENQTATKDAEIAKWEQRYKVARKEIEERINIMDEVESDNIELDSALCKSIVEQERLQMLLYQRDESLEVMNADRMAQESRMLAIKEEIDHANERIHELDSVVLQKTRAPSSIDDASDVSLPESQQLAHEQQLELLNRELVGKNRMLDQLRQELRIKDSQLDELQLELTCLSTLASDDSKLTKDALDGAPNVVIDDDAVLVQAPTNLLSVAPRQVDKLQQILGIGAKLEHVLNDLGIYQFRQIAEFTAADLVWLDQQLGSFKGRMTRDNWVAQAEVLALDKIDEELGIH